MDVSYCEVDGICSLTKRCHDILLLLLELVKDASHGLGKKIKGFVSAIHVRVCEHFNNVELHKW